MKKLLLALVLLILVATPAYAGKPPTKEPRGRSPDKCESTGTCGNGDHGRGQDKENPNPNSWKGEPDPPSTSEPEVTPEPIPEVTPETVATATPELVLDPPVQIEDPIVEPGACPASSECDICAELAEIKANQQIIISLLQAILQAILAIGG